MSVKPVVTRGRAWVGMYRGKSGHLGWLMPNFLDPNRGAVLSTEQEEALANSRKYASDMTFYRVEVKLTPLKNKKGKYIVRLPRKRKKETA